MSDPSSSKLVPASLVRIRCFLNRRGMKVKPWLGPAAVLDAFYAALRSQTKNDGFWGELERLLGDLASDMNQRVATRGWVIQNELLDQPTHAELLAQIRQALGLDPVAAAGLRPLAATLPARAGALLLMLAAAIVVGCGGEVESGQAVGAGGTTVGSGGTTVASGGAAASLGGTTGRGGATFITIDTTPQELPCPNPDKTSGLDPNQFAACNPKLVEALIPYDIHSYSGKQLLQCVCLLNDAWQTGFAELFAGQSCGEIASYFRDCGLNQICSADPSQVPLEFDADLFVDNCSIPVYVGVRCD